MKKLLLLAALVLSACSNPTPAPQQADATAAAPAATTSPALATTSQWLLIARNDPAGGIYVDPSLTKTDAATGLTDVVLKVDHGDSQTLDESAGIYRIEKVTFRFNCANQTYALVKREAISVKGDVLGTTEGNVTPAGFKAVSPKGVSSVAVGQACPQKMPK